MGSGSDPVGSAKDWPVTWTDLPNVPISCASEVAKRMGASDEEMVMVAGFAGGIGLSGNACGALAAAVWMNTLRLVQKAPLEILLPILIIRYTKNILKKFYARPVLKCVS